jgi:hypothetical protein
MSWKRERDSLIAQTMAFVQSVTGRKEEAGRESTQFASADTELAVMEALEQELSPPKAKAPALEPVRIAAPPPPLPAARITPSKAQGEMANEIRARVASFRAHQERFNREREEYFTATITRLRQAIKDVPPPRHK